METHGLGSDSRLGLAGPGRSRSLGKVVQAFAIGCVGTLSALAPGPGFAQQQPRVERTPATVDSIPSPYPEEPTNTSVFIRLPNDVAGGDRDASTAIQQAVDKAAQSGGTVEFPPGRYYVAQTLKLQSNVTLLGASPNQTFLEDRGPESPPAQRPADSDTKQSSVLVQADHVATMIVVDQQGDALSHNIAVRGLDFVVEGGPGNKNRQFIAFQQCRDVYLGHCSFDSSDMSGKFGMFHQVDFTQCDGTTCIHNRFHNALAGTGTNGAAWTPELGKRGYFAMNLVTEYVDTGIGLWTGAHDCLVERNVLRGYSSDTNPYAVGVDCDGPHHCTIRRNVISGGQIGVRLYDCHRGEYPISAVTVEKNRIADQRSNPNGNPAACIKVVHEILASLNYSMDFDIRDNHFGVVSRGIMMYSYAKRGGPDWCLPGIRGNTFTNQPGSPGQAILIGGFQANGQYIFQTSRNDFFPPPTPPAQLSEGNPVIKVENQ